MRIFAKPKRAGFTLVEVLVAAALSLGIMVVLTGLFQTGMESFRKLKAIGEMQERLRTVASILKHDLATPHFGGISTDGGPFLKDQKADLSGWEPPARGFFRIVQGSGLGTPSYFVEGADADGIPALIATNHALHFSINVLRNSNQSSSLNPYSELLSTRLYDDNNPVQLNSFLALSEPEAFIDQAKVPIGTTYSGNLVSPWAEVAYYLRETGAVENPDVAPPPGGALKLFALCRRQRLILRQDGLPVPPDYQEISSVDGGPGNPSNSPATIAHPDRRWLGITAGTGRPYSLQNVQLGIRNPLIHTSLVENRKGDDVIMTDVISFEVRPTWQPVTASWAVGTPHGTPPRPSGNPLANPNANFDFPFDDLPFPVGTAISAPRIFDTWTNRNDPLFPVTAPMPPQPATNDYAQYWKPDPNALMLPLTPVPSLQMPLKLRITGLQIRIRVWDYKLNSARQVTIVQDA